MTVKSQEFPPSRRSCFVFLVYGEGGRKNEPGVGLGLGSADRSTSTTSQMTSIGIVIYFRADNVIYCWTSLSITNGPCLHLLWLICKADVVFRDFPGPATMIISWLSIQIGAMV